MRINLLPEEVKNRISSGEVIEGPAECVKELMENSLDAGATFVDVEVIKGGKRYISVRDNGIGIPSEDISKAVMSGATSKLRTLEDLQSLSTYGFRGEALHAISLVSKMVLRSRFFQEEVGKELKVEGGKVVSEKLVGMPVGTHVEVYDLFYNAPVRSAFLGKEDTERRKIYKVFKALALANPKTAFRLRAEGKDIYHLKPAIDIKERAEEVFQVKLEHITKEEQSFKVDLLLPLNREGKELFLFINGRPVQNKSLSEYVRRTLGKTGLVLCYVRVPPYLLDVNVHPKKTEVKILKEGNVKNLIKSALETRHKHMPALLSQKKAEYQTEPELIGIIDNTLIVAKLGDYLYFFDQHLLSERYNYEVLKMEEDKACRSSIKAGDRLDQKRAKELLNLWLSFENKEVCPHGRPIYYRIYLGDIYKKLQRG
ncbi:DNA mismatch repair endonuclease MutL [Pampinifervens florentissimum]|uniref:DNA mismatch repair endonuclease MutL n=1 Tax=Pampinifervens florentissimum TaxID=1632019 RepID=UPI0013B49686|nr:DNA mismatch repair endonuclease MutL [Hydrogenobacter sp. T-8]QID33210.1 DNA mismatch repair protein MutL [Hydrogenobacter sp. T-8]